MTIASVAVPILQNAFCLVPQWSRYALESVWSVSRHLRRLTIKECASSVLLSYLAHALSGVLSAKE